MHEGKKRAAPAAVVAVNLGEAEQSTAERSTG